MNESPKKYWTDDPELLERYVLGRLTPEEKKRLDGEIAECEPCKELLRREMELAAGIRRHGRDAMRSRLRLRLRKDPGFSPQQFQVIGLVAAVVIIAIGAGVYTVFLSDIETPKNLIKREIVFKQAEQPPSEKKEEKSAPTEKTPAQKDVVRESPEEQEEAGPASPARERSSRRAAPEKKSSDIALADDVSASSSPVKTKRFVPSKSIWLLGTVVMVPDAQSGASGTADTRVMAERRISGFDKSRSPLQKKVTVQRGDREEEIVVQQRSFSALPPSRQTQMGKQNRVETLIETSSEGLLLTIYSDALNADEIDNATVESFSADSLVISTPSQKISYRLPAELFRPSSNPSRR